MNWNQILEDAIVGKLVVCLVDEGFRVEISNVDGGGLFVYAAPDGGYQPKDGWKYWVRLVPGNNVGIIVAYTSNLEDVIKDVLIFSKTFRG